MHDRTRPQPQNNGNHQPHEYVPLPEARATGMTAAQEKAMREAKAKLARWDHGREGQDRGQVLKGIIKRLHAETDVPPEYFPALIVGNVRLQGLRAYTEEEVREAMDTRRTLGARLEGEPQLLRGIRPNEVKTREVAWFLPKVIARGYYTMVSGRRGVGKSTFFTGMAALSSHTLWLCGEEGLDDMVVPRLAVHGISERRVEFFTRDHQITFPHCKAALVATMKNYKTELLIIDPLTAFLGTTADANSNEQMQPVLQSLAEVADKTRAAVLVCLHPGKAMNNTIRGASVFNTHPRIIIELVKDDGPPKRRMMTNPKNNLAGEQPSREYHADAVGTGDLRRFRLGAAVNEADTLFAQEVTDRLDRLIVTDCEEWLKCALKNGPRLRKDIMCQAKDEGYAPRTVERAADKAGVLKQKGNSFAGEGSSWVLADWEPVNPFDTPPTE